MYYLVSSFCYILYMKSSVHNIITSYTCGIFIFFYNKNDKYGANNFNDENRRDKNYPGLIAISSFTTKKFKIQIVRPD